MRGEVRSEASGEVNCEVKGDVSYLEASSTSFHDRNVHSNPSNLYEKMATSCLVIVSHADNKSEWTAEKGEEFELEVCW